MMVTRIGTILATVTTELMKAACSTPFKIRKWKVQMPISDTMMAVTVLPPPNTGKKAPSVEPISTQ